MRGWRSIVIPAGLALGLLTAAGARAQAPLDRARVEAFVDGALGQAMREDRVAGVTVAVVDRTGVVMTKGYGRAGVSPARPVDADTLFRVGSISKTVVWISLMQLVEQGRISLDDPVNDHLPPDLRLPDEGFRNPVRVRHLMSHSAGFEDSVLGGFFLHDPARLQPLDDWLRTHRVHRVREPGTLAVYSNYGAALAAALVAHVSGESWPDYAERHVLRPLGMTTATYREPYSPALAKAHGLPAPMPPATLSRVTSGFDLKAGALEAQPFEYIGNVAPAGALSASARDMAAYMRALLDPALMERAGVLRAATFATLRAPLFANTPELGSWRHGFMDFTAESGRPGYGHGGDVIFQHSTLEIYPDAGVGVFISVNTPTGMAIRYTLPTALMATFVGPVAPAPPRAANARAEAVRVAGTYSALRRPSYRTERALLGLFSGAEVKALPNGDIVTPQGTQVIRFYPVGGGVFAQVDGPARIAFHEVGGRMLRFDPFSAGPSERIGFFQGPAWLFAIVGAGLVTAAWGVGSAARRASRRRQPGRAAGWVLDGLCLVWFVAFGLTAVGAAGLGDPNAAVFTYPGVWLPVGLWALLAAALATPVAGVTAMVALRPTGWSVWRWLRQSAALAVFAALAVTLWTWGMLGYSGW